MLKAVIIANKRIIMNNGFWERFFFCLKTELIIKFQSNGNQIINYWNNCNNMTLSLNRSRNLLLNNNNDRNKAPR